MSYRRKLVLLLACTAALCGCGSNSSGNSNAPAVQISPGSINFGALPVGTKSPPQFLTLLNNGNAPLAISNVTLTGTPASSFTITNGCGTTLASGSTCQIQLTLLPNAPGQATASLSIADNAPNSPQSVAISGTGLAPAGALVSPPSLSFGSILVDMQSAAQTVQLTNPGGETLSITSVGLTGPGASSYTLTNSCGSTLAAEASCKIAVDFGPTAATSLSASLVIADNASGSPQSVALTGTGRARLLPSVIVYGATPAGIAAAIEAAQLGKQVTLLEPSQHVGGMMSSGLGFSDTYASAAIGGIARQFFQNVNTYYAGNPASGGGLYFEPHAAEDVFNSMLAQQSNITIVPGASLASVQMTGTAIAGLTASNGVTYAGGEYIDASYTGDLMAAANVTYTVGRESTLEYDEPSAGVSTPALFGLEPIDPYSTPGDPNSGLIAHVQPDTLGAPGTADSSVMAYNYRMCITFDPSNKIPFPVPALYNPAEFEILGRLSEGTNPPMQITGFLVANELPNNKLDMNTHGYFSTNEVGESNGYPNGSAAQREQIAAEQARYIQALMYFLQTDSRIPKAVQQKVQGVGLCKDEFTDNGGWPRQIYVREARRMIGTYVLTEADVNLQTTVPDSIGLGGYNIDDHNHHIVNIDGAVYVDRRVGYHPSPYPISYRILTPLVSQVSNLLVPVDFSSSDVAYNSLRIETTYMIVGQAAGAAASLAIDAQQPVQDVDYGALSAQLQKDGAVLTPP